MALGFGIGIPFIRRRGDSVDAQAQAHFDRVIADGGQVPSGLSGVNAFFTTIKSIYGTADITTAISVGLDAQVLGYKLGAGAGTTLGQAAQKLYSCSGASGDVVQTTAASQPLLLVHEGANYWQGVNVTNNAVSTPDAPANRITLDLEIIAYVKHTNNTTLNSLVSKNDNSTQRGYSLVFETNNLVLYYGLTTLNVASSTATIASGSTLWVRCTRNATTGEIQFFTSTNPAATNPQSVTWTQLGATISGLIGPINSSGSMPLLIGGYVSVNSGFRSLEKIYRLTISNSIGGAPVVDFNPSTYNAATSQTQWTSSTGEVWTINTGTATTGYKGVLVDRTIMQGDGIGDDLISGTIANKQFFTSYIACNLLSFSGRIRGGNTTLQQIIFGSASNLDMFGGAGSISFTGETPNRLQLLTANYAASPNAYTRINSLARNNPAIDIGNAISNKISIFSDANTLFSNVNINTVIESVTNDPLNDAMYNYIKSINNNAF
jgi:hypothetical protein